MPAASVWHANVRKTYVLIALRLSTCRRSHLLELRAGLGCCSGKRYIMLLAATSAVGRRAPTRLLATTAQPTRLLVTTTARRAPTRLLATTAARRRNDRPAVNQRLLRLVDDGPSPGAAVGDLWAGVEGAQGAWPARDRLESKSDMKRHLRYLASLKLLRTVPGEPFRYALNRNAYVRRELEEEDAAPAEDSKQ